MSNCFVHCVYVARDVYFFRDDNSNGTLMGTIISGLWLSTVIRTCVSTMLGTCFVLTLGNNPFTPPCIQYHYLNLDCPMKFCLHFLQPFHISCPPHLFQGTTSVLHSACPLPTKIHGMEFVFGFYMLSSVLLVYPGHNLQKTTFAPSLNLTLSSY